MNLPAVKTVSRLRVGLGTFVAVEADADDPAIAERAISLAFDAISRVDRLMHPTRAGSDLARLGDCAAGGSVRIHPWTWEVLDLCSRIHVASLGVFDPCLPSAPGRLGDLDLRDDSEVRLAAPVAVDLGGVAKGYAVDRALDALSTAGCGGGLVNAGGDLAVFGPRAHRITCRTSLGARTVEVRDAALATSDAGQPSKPSEHRGYYHGRTGARMHTGGVSIVAPRAAVADALTKCVLWLTPASADALLRHFDAYRADG